jgi:histidine triad (HIT) family protein
VIWNPGQVNTLTLIENKMNDFYCEQILSGRLKVEVVVETPHILAFKHTTPYWPVHIVVIPKKHIESIAMLTANDSAMILDAISVVAKVATDIQANHGGCRVSTNVGNYQSAKHLHWYIHSGKRLRDESGKLLSGVEP